MERAYRGRINEIIQYLNDFKEQIFELSNYEKPKPSANRNDLQTKIRGKNVVDFNNAMNSIYDVILYLENIICREPTDEVTE